MTSRVLGDRYKLDGRLGAGGMASVFSAEDLHLHRRQVAVKVLHEHLADDPRLVERFRREAEHMSELAHPNIVTILDWSADESSPYLVMEFVDGGSLRDLLGMGRLPVRNAVEIVVQVLGALQYAHSHGIVHRDIKPENILIHRLGEDDEAAIKVGDFGIAKALVEEVGLTQTGLLGTPCTSRRNKSRVSRPRLPPISTPLGAFCTSAWLVGLPLSESRSASPCNTSAPQFHRSLTDPMFHQRSTPSSSAQWTRTHAIVSRPPPTCATR
jgi:serine/threonine protein kinase